MVTEAKLAEHGDISYSGAILIFTNISLSFLKHLHHVVTLCFIVSFDILVEIGNLSDLLTT